MNNKMHTSFEALEARVAELETIVKKLMAFEDNRIKKEHGDNIGINWNLPTTEDK